MLNLVEYSPALLEKVPRNNITKTLFRRKKKIGISSE